MDDQKPEWPPLLKAGFWPMTLDGVRALCVDAFPLSTRRPMIMQGLETVIQVLHECNIQADVWLDGSFLTRKIEPDDVDLVLCYDADIYHKDTEEFMYIIKLFDNTTELEKFNCHSFILPKYSKSDNIELQGFSEWDRAYWIHQFGVSRGNDEHGRKVNDGVFKGMALIRTPFSERDSTGCSDE